MGKNKNTGAPKKNKTTVGIIVIAVAIAAVLGFKYVKDAVNLSQKKISAAKSTGPGNAPIQIVEYADYQCPACANGVKILDKFMEEHPGAIHLQFKYFPLSSIHSHTMLASRYGECSARQGKFWEYSRAVFARQDQWKDLFDAHPAFDAIAKEIGLDANAVTACLHDPKVDELIDANKEEGNKLGIKSTPTYFINGSMAVGTKNLESELQKLLSAQEKH